MKSLVQNISIMLCWAMFCRIYNVNYSSAFIYPFFLTAEA